MKALKALNERQSFGDRGLPKLKANTMKTSELRMTRVQSPDADVSSWVIFRLPNRDRPDPVAVARSSHDRDARDA